MKSYLERIIERRKVLDNDMRKDLKEEAQRLVKILKNKGFKFKRVYLFGSIFL